MPDSLTRGAMNPDVVDLISPDPETDEVVLTVLEDRPWGSAPDQLRQLQDKLNNYLAYVLDGFLAKEYPQYDGKAIRFELDCVEAPGQGERGFMTAFRNYADSQSIRFVIAPRG